MTCKLSVCQNIGFETITLNSKGPGSHNYVIDSTFNHIKASIQNLEPLMKIVEITNIQKLRTKISDLKLLRVQSDYQNLEIDEELSDKALIFSQEIISKLNTFIP
jgi:hypothetical protein